MDSTQWAIWRVTSLDASGWEKIATATGLFRARHRLDAEAYHAGYIRFHKDNTLSGGYYVNPAGDCMIMAPAHWTTPWGEE